MPKLKVAFSDFWAGFDPEVNFFTAVLRSRFEVEISSHPDLLLCSTFGHDWKNFSCPRVLFTGENLSPDPRLFDASLSFEPNRETNYYLPLYRLYGSYPQAFEERTIDEAGWAQKKRIGIVFSNAHSRFRTSSFHTLNQAIGVGSGGKAFNNVGGPVADKGAFLQGFRFSMAFENTAWPGYTTEKLLESYCFGTVPLYWGDPLVDQTFNPRAFFSVTGRKDFPRLVTGLQGLVEDFPAYKKIYEEPLFPDNREPDFLKAERIADFLEQTVARGWRRTHRGTVTPYQVYQWSSRWKYREWDHRRAAWIGLLQRFSWFGYVMQEIKHALKRLLGRSA